MSDEKDRTQVVQEAIEALVETVMGHGGRLGQMQTTVRTTCDDCDEVHELPVLVITAIGVPQVPVIEAMLAHTHQALEHFGMKADVAHVSVSGEDGKRIPVGPATKA